MIDKENIKKLLVIQGNKEEVAEDRAEFIYSQGVQDQELAERIHRQVKKIARDIKRRRI
jgi:hypothetical protein